MVSREEGGNEAAQGITPLAYSVEQFCRGHSIVSNAMPHRGKAAIVRMDLKDFFPSTPALRVNYYFRFIGWNAQMAQGALKRAELTFRGEVARRGTKLIRAAFAAGLLETRLDFT